MVSDIVEGKKLKDLERWSKSDFLQHSLPFPGQSWRLSRTPDPNPSATVVPSLPSNSSDHGTGARPGGPQADLTQNQFALLLKTYAVLLKPFVCGVTGTSFGRNEIVEVLECDDETIEETTPPHQQQVCIQSCSVGSSSSNTKRGYLDQPRTDDEEALAHGQELSAIDYNGFILRVVSNFVLARAATLQLGVGAGVDLTEGDCVEVLSRPHASNNEVRVRVKTASRKVGWLTVAKGDEVFVK